jgi:hypothetical protein
MKRISLLLVAAALLGVSCERHEFDGPDGTRRLHEHHSSHGGADHHGDAKDAGH